MTVRKRDFCRNVISITLQQAQKCGILFAQSQKTTAEPENSNNKTLANSSTPNRAFFIRSTRTPKARLERLSMVACNRKGSALCCVPMFAVSQPVTRYRQTLRSRAVALKSNIGATAKMLFKFILLGKRRLKIATYANSEAEARQLLNLDRNQAVFYARVKGGVYA
ncbi:hypothetical protein GVX81_09060 [[Haemophilus] felis]|uniref:Host cell division inhibitor Icd-like protein n=1 Tax=[Haemophilus] felis TaxID=123822 RepID=A0A1T0AVN7_9PAST|nr:hypothetical protein [[Haemophilus] felis]OOS01137.1 hypothetical protein B0188_10140 [[Haemophilus] felis]